MGSGWIHRLFPAAVIGLLAGRLGATDWDKVFQERRRGWSWQPIQHPTVPPVSHTPWSGHPVDRFLLAKLEENHLGTHQCGSHCLHGARAAHSGRLAGKLPGTLRSPTFTLTHDQIHLHVAGQGGQIRLIISRYGLREFNPLLFENTFLDVNTDGQFAWRSITSGLHRQ